MIAAAGLFLVAGVVLVVVSASRLTQLGDDRLSQLSRGALRPVDADRYVAALLVGAAGVACLVIGGMVLPAGWWHG